MFVTFLNETAISLILQYGILEKLVTSINSRPDSQPLEHVPILELEADPSGIGKKGQLDKTI